MIAGKDKSDISFLKTIPNNIESSSDLQVGFFVLNNRNLRSLRLFLQKTMVAFEDKHSLQEPGSREYGILEN